MNIAWFLKQKNMSKLQTLMLNHPLVSIAIIMPFSLALVFAILEIIFNLILPVLIAVWLSGWIYTGVVGRPIRQYVYEPFWFIHL